MKKALLVIDIQNDYFDEKALLLYDVEKACKNALEIIAHAKENKWLIIAIQHINLNTSSLLFQPNTKGVEIHPAIIKTLNKATIITKHHTDCFHETALKRILEQANIVELYLTGMMIQHCVTHTALSPQAQGMNIHIIAKGCAAPYKMIHDFALSGLSSLCNIV